MKYTLKKIVKEIVKSFDNPFKEDVSHTVFFRIYPTRKKYLFSVNLMLKDSDTESILEKLSELYERDEVRTHHANFTSGKSVILDAIQYVDDNFENATMNKSTSIVKVIPIKKIRFV